MNNPIPNLMAQYRKDRETMDIDKARWRLYIAAVRNGQAWWKVNKQAVWDEADRIDEEDK